MNRWHDPIAARGASPAPGRRRVRPTPAAAALLVASAGLFAIRCSGESLPSPGSSGAGGQVGGGGIYGAGGLGSGGWIGSTGGRYSPETGGRGMGGERGPGGAMGTACDALPNPGCVHGAPGPTTDGIVCDDVGYAPDCIQGAWVCTNGMPMSQCTCYGSPYRGPYVSCVCTKTGWLCTSLGGTGGNAGTGGAGTGGNLTGTGGNLPAYGTGGNDGTGGAGTGGDPSYGTGGAA